MAEHAPVAALSPQTILRDVRLQPMARFLFAELCAAVNEGVHLRGVRDGWLPDRSGWFTEREIAIMIYVRDRQHEYLRELVAAGIIQRRRNGGRGPYLYTLPHVSRRYRSLTQFELVSTVCAAMAENLMRKPA